MIDITRYFVLQGALQHGPWLAGLASLAVTPLGYAAIAALLERRILRIREEYIALIYGDPLLAVAVAVGTWLLHGQLPKGIAGSGPSLFCMCSWLGLGLIQWLTDLRSGRYTLSQASAPTKIWHQLVVYPVIGYWTWAACAGGILTPDTSSDATPRIAAKTAIALCIAAWMLANVYDRRHPKLGHPPYDWRRLRQQLRPWPAKSASLRNYTSRERQFHPPMQPRAQGSGAASGNACPGDDAA
jgi:hypothetical protein